MATGRGIFSGCMLVLLGTLIVLVVACMMPATQVNSLERFFMVATATVIPYSFGVMVGVSAVYHSRRRYRFIGMASACAILALTVVVAISGKGTIFSPRAQGLQAHLPAAVVAVWVFLPLFGLVFGALAVAISGRQDAPDSTA